MSNELLSIDKINSLPHPLMIREFSSDPWYELIEIDVQTGVHSIDVCGMRQVNFHLSSCGQIKDDHGEVHDIEIFFTDCEAQPND